MIKSKLKKNIHMAHDELFNFYEMFNLDDGTYVRTGILDANGKEGADPFMRSFPGLLDIGIMGGCKCADIPNGCSVDCYQGKRPFNPDADMKLEDYKRIVDEGAANGLMQVALGGAGNPNDHRDFAEICRYTRSLNIIPNYTTAGVGLTDAMVAATKQYCGAVAVSWHTHVVNGQRVGNDYTVQALNKFTKANCRTNVHYVLSRETIDDAIELLETGTVPVVVNNVVEHVLLDVNAVVFLLYKPVGKGRQELVLTLDQDAPKLRRFMALVSDKRSFKVGFDSCTIPAVLAFNDQVDPQSTDTCEGGRFSAYISADMVMVPCSFDQNHRWGVDLRKLTVAEAWDSLKFAEFRSHLRTACVGCKSRELCLGGCPVDQSVVLCDSADRVRGDLA